MDQDFWRTETNDRTDRDKECGRVGVRGVSQGNFLQKRWCRIPVRNGRVTETEVLDTQGPDLPYGVRAKRRTTRQRRRGRTTDSGGVGVGYNRPTYPTPCESFSRGDILTEGPEYGSPRKCTPTGVMLGRPI